ncbi:MAG: DUF4132 domain-containing protein [Polyangiaceae bacterium]
MANADSTSRQLVFEDGSSHKFWDIVLDGSSHTVRFGRVGTDGQTQTKDFGSKDEARKAFDKLVAQKLKKGYEDAAGSTAQPAKASAKPATASAKSAKAASSQTKTKQTAKAKEKPAASEVQSSQPEAAAVDLQVTRSFDLLPTDWYRATFREQQPMPLPEPSPFDKDKCLARLAKLPTTSYDWDVKWDKLNLPRSLSKEEAHFWLVAMTTKRAREVKMKDFAAKFAKRKFDGAIEAEAAVKLLRSADRHVSVEAALALANLLTPEAYLEAYRTYDPGKKTPWDGDASQSVLLDGFHRFIVPYLTEKERKALQKLLRKDWDPNFQPTSPYDQFPPSYYAAAALGMSKEVYQVTSKWADDQFSEEYGYYSAPQQLVLGLGSPELVAAEWKRLKLHMRDADEIRAFIACTETSALECVVDTILAQTNKEEAAKLLEALALVRAPEAAEPMLRCKLDSKAQAQARAWLDFNVGNAVHGLLETAAGRGSMADAAIEYLRQAKRLGYESVIAAAIKAAKKSPGAVKVQSDVLDHEEKTYEPLNDKTTPKWLTKELASVSSMKHKRLPAWATAANLPPLRLGDHRLNDEQLELVLQALAATNVGDKSELFSALREHGDKQNRDDFAWKLFQLWTEDGSPSKEKWAMGAVGHLGGDACVMKLTPMIRAWPGESQHARAVFGLQCLRAVGTDIALMQLSGIAQKLKFKGLKAQAEQCVEDIARDKGMTRAELEDRIIPDCGLSENGTREFSFGSRAFSFVLGGDLKPAIKDSAGKVRPNLPNPGAKDDAELAATALNEWKLMKKQIKEVAAIQAARLEQAMVTGRRWPLSDFDGLIVKHPLMTHLAQKLIWGSFDANGNRKRTFRVTEERDYADAADEALKIDAGHQIGVVHPLELTDAERASWGEVLSDYEVVAPFAQLGREVYQLEKAEEKSEELGRFNKLKLAAPTLVHTLEKLGWTRGQAMDAGGFDEHSKQFPSAKVTAVVHYDGIVGMGWIDPDELLTISSLYFCAGMRQPSGYGWNSEKKLKLSKVHPIVISEVIADLMVIKSKAK